MGDVVSLTRNPDVTDMLCEAADQHFDECVIVGIVADGVHMKASTSIDRLRTLGALQAAIQHVQDNW